MPQEPPGELWTSSTSCGRGSSRSSAPLTAVFAVLTVTSSVLYATPAIIGLVLVGVGIHDLVQSRHSILRNYPLLGHLRFLAEGVGPEIRQYFVESNTGGRPFDRDQRSLMYRRSKDIDAVKAFGTELDVYREGYGFISHSMAPKPIRHDAERAFRVDVGGPECTRPYSSSILNISAMSFGALSGPAIEALNAAARDGGFAHNTGEGGISGYHRRPGGDLIWQIGTGYFGCRTPDGAFDPERFAEQARDGQVKMVEVKVSQGAKPGHGGILPAVKVSPEIAEAREIPVGEACFSPPGHSAFSTPAEMLEFIARLRDLSGGKPAGFKLCVGDPRELFAVCKAMETTGITPDFVSVDGGEGGTGAAPLEYSDHLGMPLREGLVLVNNALARAGVREQVRVGAAGKRVDSFEIASAIASGRRPDQHRARVHVQPRLHPGAALSHQHLPGWDHHPEPAHAPGARRRRQGAAGEQLPPQHRPRSGRADRRVRPSTTRASSPPPTSTSASTSTS